MFVPLPPNYRQPRVQLPLGFVDINAPFHRPHPKGLYAIQAGDIGRMKRRTMNGFNHHTFSQNQIALTQNNRVNYKQNVIPTSPKSSANICFSIKNTTKNQHKLIINSTSMQSLTCPNSRQPRRTQFVQNIPIKSFDLGIESYIAKNKQLQSVAKIDQPAADTKQSDFERIRELGKGKFGTVFLVRHVKSNFVCAMKIIKKSVVRQEKVEHQVAKEIRIHNVLKHINIISFYGYFHDKDHFYILTQFATGGQVYSLLKTQHRLSEAKTSKIVRETADGLEMMHNLGFIHRDIKPENLILQFNTVKICDLGWAAECSASEMRKSVCGTPLYYSPELVRQVPYNSLIDVWSLGLLAYELIVGRIPFKIWSEFDLPVILEQEVQFPDYIDIKESTKLFILNCLTKLSLLRPNISMLKDYSFLSRRAEEYSPSLNRESQSLF